MDITRMGSRRLKLRYGASNGQDREAEAELQRRGLNSKQLREVIWEHDQRKWRKETKKASKIRGARKAKKRICRRRRWKKRRKERRRQEQRDRFARVKAGVVVTGERLDPSACDGSCPFGKDAAS
jgi:hypothetical protein